MHVLYMCCACAVHVMYMYCACDVHVHVLMYCMLIRGDLETGCLSTHSLLLMDLVLLMVWFIVNGRSPYMYMYMQRFQDLHF